METANEKEYKILLDEIKDLTYEINTKQYLGFPVNAIDAAKIAVQIQHNRILSNIKDIQQIQYINRAKK